jgi:Flp pilus assembly protein TadG
VTRREHLTRDERGSAAIEFSVLAPVMCLLLVGAFDIAHSLYMRGTVQGIVQKTARDATLEGSTDAASQTALDDKVKAQVRALANNSTIVITRRYYRTFSLAAAAQAEPWTDTDHNGTCNNNEPYTDNNGNGTWDADGGDDGQGGAKDRTLYTVTVTYPRFFPLYKYIGGSTTTKIVATTILENQPYTDQGSYGAPVVRHCT